MKSHLISATSLAIILLLASAKGFSQQTVAIGDSNPKANAILYLKGNGNQGLIIPIVATLGNFGESGMVVYNSTDKKIHYHDGSSWTVVGGGGAVSSDLVIGNEVTGVGSNGALQLGGGGTAASPLTVSMIAGTSTGQVLKWNNTTSKWELGTDNSGSVSLNAAQILVGNASNVATAATVSGDATLTNAGALTIASGAVNSAKILDGTITNTDIAANAAIALSKIAQNAATNGQVLKWNGTAWAPAADDAGSVALNSAQIIVGNAGNVPTATSVSGDATLSNTGALTLANGSVNSAKIQDGTIANADISTTAGILPSKIAQASATAGQVLEWNGTAWAPATDDAGGVALNSAQILVGNAANVPAATSVSGDATLSNTGALTLSNGSVNSAKIQDGTIANADISTTAGILPSKIAQASATAGQVLEWNGTAWAPATDDAAGVALNSAQILVGNAANVPAATLVSGDATLSNTGALTLSNGSVNSTKIQDGTIANADISTTAGILPSKIAQVSATAGQVLEWNGTAWAPATDDAGGVALNSAQILVGNAANVPAATTVSGDATLSNIGALTLANGSVNSAKILDGTIANADVATNAAIAPSKIGQASAANGQVLKWNGTAWAPAADNGISTTLNNAQIIVGSAGNTANPVSMGGDATITNAGTITIANNAINSAKIADASITNIDISAGAAIAGSKVNPDFGGQNVTTTGGVTGANVTSNGNAYHYGYTQLGSASPLLATIKMTGLTPAFSGGSIAIPVPGGVHADKIIAVSCHVKYFDSGYVAQNYTQNSGYQFQYYYYYNTSDFTTYVVIWMVAGNDVNIQGKTYMVLVTYEQ